MSSRLANPTHGYRTGLVLIWNINSCYLSFKGSRPGQVLTPSTMTQLRASIQRAIAAPPYSREINIVQDSAFTKANNMFTARCKLYFAEGHVPRSQQPIINDDDIAKLGKYFEVWPADPTVLLEANWFNLCYFFGRRGRENWAYMTKDTFIFNVDENGQEYVFMDSTQILQRDAEDAEQKMYGPGVVMLKYLIGKLNPNCERLFQYPDKSFRRHGTWYIPSPMGKTPIGKLMQTISQKAGLSEIYSCHSIRGSVIDGLYRGDPNNPTVGVAALGYGQRGMFNQLGINKDGGQRSINNKVITIRLPGSHSTHGDINIENAIPANDNSGDSADVGERIRVKVEDTSDSGYDQVNTYLDHSCLRHLVLKCFQHYFII